MLLFHPDPERFFTGAYVKIGFFENNVDLRHHDEIHGDLFTQVEQTIDLVRRVMVDAPHPAVSLKVPLQVDARAAQNWDEAH